MYASILSWVERGTTSSSIEVHELELEIWRYACVPHVGSIMDASPILLK
jgi:hypothetical protein